MKFGAGMTSEHPGVVLAREMMFKSKTYQDSQAIIKQFFYLTKREQEFFLLFVAGHFALKNGGSEAVTSAITELTDKLQEFVNKKDDK